MTYFSLGGSFYGQNVGSERSSGQEGMLTIVHRRGLLPGAWLLADLARTALSLLIFASLF